MEELIPNLPETKYVEEYDENMHVTGVGDEVITSFIVSSLFAVILMYHIWRTSDFSSVREWFAQRWAEPPVSADQVPRPPVSWGFSAEARCLICLEDPQLPLRTNCGHQFCAECLINWLDGYASRQATTSCPACRQHVSALLREFDPVEDDVFRQNMLRRMNLYNRRYSGEPRPFIEHIRDLPLLLSYVLSEFFSMGGLMYMFRLRIFLCFVAAIVYLVSPLDVLPEAMFGVLGFLDDLFVVVLLGVYMTLVYRRFLADRWADD